MSKEQLRKEMPECAAFIDDIRKSFGIVGIKAKENGKTVEWGKNINGEEIIARVYQR